MSAKWKASGQEVIIAVAYVVQWEFRATYLSAAETCAHPVGGHYSNFKNCPVE